MDTNRPLISIIMQGEMFPFVIMELYGTLLHNCVGRVASVHLSDGQLRLNSTPWPADGVSSCLVNPVPVRHTSDWTCYCDPFGSGRLKEEWIHWHNSYIFLLNGVT
ncbi:hypothetical protein L798_06823 [Zootermopsis nevadensis]|uniref:Uncharacterized protein n=1 Tax=Zootermopsis nevadensis TaxID=136037 RepID=A0A067R774_ZOONE|nr:hypothetical protein L798_06823 [Zootermopsis nevadensis]